MSDKVSVRCPHCKKKGVLNLPSHKTGKVTIKCPHCGVTFDHVVEQRFYYRKVPLPTVRYGPFDFNFEKLPGRGELMDISISGCRVGTNQSPPQKGDDLSLSFQLPVDEPMVEMGGELLSLAHPEDVPQAGGGVSKIEVGGKVVWVRKSGKDRYEFGVRFTFVDEENMKRIGFYLFPHHKPQK